MKDQHVSFAQHFTTEVFSSHAATHLCAKAKALEGHLGQGQGNLVIYILIKNCYFHGIVSIVFQQYKAMNYGELWGTWS